MSSFYGRPEMRNRYIQSPNRKSQSPFSFWWFSGTSTFFCPPIQNETNKNLTWHKITAPKSFWHRVPFSHTTKLTSNNLPNDPIYKIKIKTNVKFIYSVWTAFVSRHKTHTHTEVHRKWINILFRSYVMFFSSNDFYVSVCFFFSSLSFWMCVFVFGLKTTSDVCSRWFCVFVSDKIVTAQCAC